jgi:periplasmic copper chaperone A
MRTALRCLIATAFVAFAFTASAHDYTVGSLHIEHPWSRATPKGAKVGAGYLVIENRGSTADRFVSVSAEFAGRTELHEMAVTDGVMRMRPLASGVEIAPGMTAKFEPGGLHVMFLDLKRPLEKGERVKATLNFEKAGAVEVVFVVEAMGGSGHNHQGH